MIRQWRRRTAHVSDQNGVFANVASPGDVRARHSDQRLPVLGQAGTYSRGTRHPADLPAQPCGDVAPAMAPAARVGGECNRTYRHSSHRGDWLAVYLAVDAF